MARLPERQYAVPGDDQQLDALLASGSPVMVTRTRHHTADGKLIGYAETMIRADRHTRAYTITGY